MGALKHYARMGLIWFIFICIGLLLCMGCTRVVYKPVKVPVPIPCVQGPVELMPIDLRVPEDVEGDLLAGDFSFLDEIFKALILLNTDRKNLAERLDACR